MYLYGVIGMICVLGFSFFAYQWSENSRASNKTTSRINYDPPTKQEKEAGDKQKEANIDREKTDESSVATQSVNIVLVDAAQYDNVVEVRTYMSNVYEDEGSCTIKFTQGDKTLTRTNEAFKDATTTQCQPFDIQRSDFPSSGEWNLNISYASDAHTGELNNIKVEIR